MTADLILAGHLRNLAADCDAKGHVPSAALHRGHARVLEHQALCTHRWQLVERLSVREECRCGAVRPVAR